MSIIGIPIPLKRRKKAKDKKEPKQKGAHKKGKFSRSFSEWRRFVVRMLGSFTVKDFTVDVDTDDVVLNAKLVPWFVMANGRAVHLNANFNGRVYVHLEVQNRFGKLAWIVIRFLIKK